MSLSHIPNWVFVVVVMGWYSLYVLVWRKNRGDRKRVEHEVSEPIDFGALSRAERIAASEPSLLEQYSQNLIPLGKFSTWHFSERDMDALVDELQRSGIESRQLFIQTLPTGVTTVLGPAGYFQIWVEPPDEVRARTFLKNKYQKEF